MASNGKLGIAVAGAMVVSVALARSSAAQLPASAADIGRGGDQAALYGWISGSDPEDGTQEGRLEGVVLTVVGPGWSRSTLSAGDGSYALTVPDTVHSMVLRLERIGYADLSVELRRVRSRLRLDFVLAPEPLPMAPLAVRGRTSVAPVARALAVLSGDLSERRAPASQERIAEIPGDLSEALPPTLLPRGDDGGVATPGAPSPRGGTVLWGGPIRRGATFVSGAPTELFGELSALAAPFAPAERTVRTWEAGAPAGVTGGQEYVVEVETPDPPAAEGTSMDASVDVLRTWGMLAWRGRRAALHVDGGSTLPWTPDVTAGALGSSRSATVRTWSAPAPTVRLSAGFSARHESQSAGSRLESPTSELGEASASVEAEAAVARGVLTVRAAGSRFSAEIPVGSDVRLSDGVRLLLHRQRTHASLVYRVPLRSWLAVDAGVDLLGHRWRGETTLPNLASQQLRGSTAGAFADAAWTPGERVAVRLGGRVDRASGAGASPAPRLHVSWHLGDQVRLEAGAGTYHQLVASLREPALAGAPARPATALASGRHRDASATLSLPVGQVRLVAYRKLLDGPEARTRVHGVGLEVSATRDTDGVGLAARLERRSGPDLLLSDPAASLEAWRHVTAHLLLRTHATVRRGADALALWSAPGDTLGLSQGVAAADSVGALDTSIRLDLELSHRRPGGTVRLYLQLLNALGRARRPLYAGEGGASDPCAPPAVVLGMELGVGRTPEPR